MKIDFPGARKSIFAKGIKRSYTRGMGKQQIVEYFEEVEASREYSGYFCSIPEAISIVVLGSMCGLRNISQIHQQRRKPILGKNHQVGVMEVKRPP